MTSHLAVLYTIAGEEVIQWSYEETVVSGYLWHELGENSLIPTPVR